MRLLLPFVCATLGQQILCDPAGELQQQVDDAVVRCREKEECELVVPAGDYDFGNRTFLIRDAKDLILRSAFGNPIDTATAS